MPRATWQTPCACLLAFCALSQFAVAQPALNDSGVVTISDGSFARTPGFRAISQVSQPPANQPTPANQPGADEPPISAPTLPPTVVEGEQQPEPTPPPPPAPPEDTGLGSYADSPFASDPGNEDGYNANSSTTGTLFDVPLLNFPGSIQVITEELMRDQGAVNLDNLVRNVPGLVLQNNAGGRQESYFLRGFSAGSSQFRKDGFRDGSRITREIANLERVEVLYGPSSVLYGSGQPSGTINLVTKKPLAQAQYNGQLMFGSYNFNRATFDATGPLNEDGTLLYRLNVAGLVSDSFRDVIFNDRAFIAPAFTWLISENTILTILGDYSYDERVLDRGVPAVNGAVGVLPNSFFGGEPTDINDGRDGQVNVILDHRFNDTWFFHGGWVSNISSETRYNSDPRALVGTQLRRAYAIQDPSIGSDHYFIGNLGAEFNLLNVGHKFLVGTEIGYTDFSNRSIQQVGGNAAVPYAIDIFNPVYGQPPPPFGPFLNTYTSTNTEGVYAQDILEIGERWTLMGSVRHDEVDQYNRTGLTHNYSRATTYRAGVVYQLVPELWSVYGSYAQSFNPVGAIDRNMELLPPETGVLWEGGTKMQLLDNLVFTMAGYQIARQNVPGPDPVDTNFSVPIGEVTSKGMEMLLTGNITDRLSVLMNCGYVDNKITQAAFNAQNTLGRRQTSVPFFTDSIWARYNFYNEPDLQLGMAIGYSHVGKRPVDSANTFDLPGYDRWDLAFYLTRGRVNLALNIENLLDEDYFSGSQSQLNIAPGAPFSVLGTMRMNY